jgi:hypothetical protein
VGLCLCYAFYPGGLFSLIRTWLDKGELTGILLPFHRNIIPAVVRCEALTAWKEVGIQLMRA